MSFFFEVFGNELHQFARIILNADYTTFKVKTNLAKQFCHIDKKEITSQITLLLFSLFYSLQHDNYHFFILHLRLLLELKNRPSCQFL